MKPLSLTLLMAGLTGMAAHASPREDTDFLVPHMAVGTHISTVFSIASSIKAEGFDELVRRNSGSSDNMLTQVSADQALTFEAKVNYDGTPLQQAQNVLSDGGARSCWNSDCQPYTDASGLLYNRLLWGAPPARLKAGMTWRVTIPKAWELGPAGTQTVTVMHVDRTDGSATLRREGTASGMFAGEPAQVALVKNGQKVTFDVTPGQAHWIGVTTFRHGLIVNDELIVTRADVLQSKETGSVAATRRRYILLNAAPFPTL